MNADEVKKIAALARMELSEEEAARLAMDFEAILGYIQKIDRLDLSSTEPACHPFDLVNVFRPDEPRPPLGAADLMRIAPKSRQGMYEVPKVVEK